MLCSFGSGHVIGDLDTLAFVFQSVHVGEAQVQD